MKLPLHPLSLMKQVDRNSMPVVHEELTYLEKTDAKNSE